MIETAAVFGEACTLVGVLGRPDDSVASEQSSEQSSGQSSEQSVGIVFLNAGLLHRVGPNRIYVTLARQLANEGMAGLRFDLSGVGDSSMRRDRMGGREAVFAETLSAINYLSDNSDASQFVLIGLCSGARSAIRVATVEERVVGVVAIDPDAFPTVQSYLHHYARRIARLRVWRRVLDGSHPGWRKLRARLAGRPTDSRTEEGRPDWDYPTRAEMEADLAQLVSRGVQICVIHTSSERYNYPGQFHHQFPKLRGHEGISVTYLEGADHTFTQRGAQRALFDVVHRWMTERPWYHD